MAMLELSMVTSAIVEMSVEAVTKHLSRSETTLRILKKLNINSQPSSDDFDSFYVYTLVNYGVNKPAAILDFFRNPNVREAFRQAFYDSHPSILEREAEEIIRWNEETASLGSIDYDPRREFASFTAVFNDLVDRARSPAEVRHDRQLVDIQQRSIEIIQKLDALKSLDEIRIEVARLQQSYQARRFTLTPSGNQLRVFISSELMELRDLREVLKHDLDERGLDAWIYEDDGGARPEAGIETSFNGVEAADIYVGLFWQKYSDRTVREYHHARTLGKPCFIYVRDHGCRRESALEHFLATELLDLEYGVTVKYFDSAVGFCPQVADDILAWLVRRHREMTAEIQAASVSQDEINKLQVEVQRLRSFSALPLPNGTLADYLARQLREWFLIVGYQFEAHEIRTDQYFEWLINVPVRRGYDRIAIIGVAKEAGIYHLNILQEAVEQHKVAEGWLVSLRRVSQAARDDVRVNGNTRLFCYTFDELLDEHADFEGYFRWLTTEIKSRGIDRHYVPLAATKDEFDPATKAKIGESNYGEENGWIDGYIDKWLDDPSKEHISVLGEFGTGKTWFALHYAWLTLVRYSDAKSRGIERPRIPLVIPLRDYAKAVSIESLFSEFIFRKHEIPLPGYSAFMQLNRMGKLLLIFDGFDEMAERVDKQKMINNFWELARCVVPGAKVILTCRNEHFPTAKEGRDLLSAELDVSVAKQAVEAPQFEVLELKKLDNKQIRRILSSRTNTDSVRQIMASHELLDLVRRPIMTELILDALPDISIGQPIDLGHIYLYAVRRKMERDIKAERTFTSMADKLYFLCELSWEMLSTNRISLNYRDFPDRLQTLFPHATQKKKDLDHWHYDMMGQTMLIRNADGDYTPAHRTLLEFFVAYKFAAEAGVLASDCTSLAQSQSNLVERAQPQDYTWSSYFRRDTDESGNVLAIHPLRQFVPEQIDKLKETVGKEPISRTVMQILLGMLDTNRNAAVERLLQLISNTRGLMDDQVGITGGNLITLLVHHDPLSLVGTNLSSTNIAYADFGNADLTNCDFRKANLHGARFLGSTLANADFRNADLTHCIFRDLGAVSSIAVCPDGTRFVCGDKHGNIHVWDMNNRLELLLLKGYSDEVASVSWANDGNQVASLDIGGTLNAWDTSNGIKTSSLKTRFREGEICFGETPSQIMIRARGEGLSVIDLQSMHISIPRFYPPKHVVYQNVAYLNADITLSFFQDERSPISVALRRNTIIVDCTVRSQRGTTVNTFSLGGRNLIDFNAALGLIAAWRSSISAVAVIKCKGETTWPKAVELYQFVDCLALHPTGKLLLTGCEDGSIRIWDVMPFVPLSQDSPISGFDYVPDLTGITTDTDSWPDWWQKDRAEAPSNSVANPNFGKCIFTIKQKINCNGLRINGARGLTEEAPDGNGQLREWLIHRGAQSS